MKTIALICEGCSRPRIHPLLYIPEAGMAVVTVVGSRLALQLVDRLRVH